MFAGLFRTKSSAQLARLELECLEDRLTPVVGAFSEAPPAPELTGVAFISTTQASGTASLLYTGRDLLTAAHVVDANGDQRADSEVYVTFHLPEGLFRLTVPPESVTIWPGWRGDVNGQASLQGDDLAVIRLPQQPPASATRYDLYRGSDEIGQTFTLAGYGLTGTGRTGEILGTSGTLRMGQNTFDSTGEIRPGQFMIHEGRGLLADFDNGTAERDAFGRSLGRSGLGLGPNEASTAPGDSGGPAFIQGRIAGISAIYASGGPSDIDGLINNSFGDFFGYTRVSAYAASIDALIQDTAGNGRVPTSQAVAFGADAGGAPVAGLLDERGREIFRVLAYGAGFSGGVRVTAADVTGDGVPDLITAPGPGLPPIIKVFNGTTGERVAAFFAYEDGFIGGAFLAAADLTGDGRAEVITSPDQGGGPRVRLFSFQAGPISRADFFGIDDPNFRGGVRLGLGDLDGDQVPDLALSAGFGGGPRTAIYSGISLVQGRPRKLVDDFFAFEASLRNGCFITIADLDGDGRNELIAGAGPGGGPRVSVRASGDPTREVRTFFAGDTANRGGVRVAAHPLTDRADALIVAPGPGSPAIVTALRDDQALWQERVLGDFLGGVYVG